MEEEIKAIVQSIDQGSISATKRFDLDIKIKSCRFWLAQAKGFEQQGYHASPWIKAKVKHMAKERFDDIVVSMRELTGEHR